MKENVFSTNNFRVLRAISECKNMAEVASSLGLTQSGVSRSIQRLESALGVRLFERKTTPVQMTSIGRFISNRSSDILDDIESLVSEVHVRSVGTSALLRLASSTSVTQTIIPFVISDLIKENIKVSAFNGNTPSICRMLLNDKADVVIASDPMHSHRTIISLPLYKERYMAVIPKEYEKKVKSKFDLIELGRSLPCIQFNENSYDVIHTSRVLRLWGLKNTIKLNGIWVSLKMISSGKAWALMPTLNLLPGRTFFEGCSFLYASEQQGQRLAYLLYKKSPYESIAKKIAEKITRTVNERINPSLESTPFEGSITLLTNES